MENPMLELIVEALLIKKAAEGPRGLAEAKLVRAFDKVHKRLSDKILSRDFTDKLTSEQLDEIIIYLEMVLTGFNTFIEQFESTAEKENPHNSGN